MSERNESALERALEKAAKIICTLQYGRCPVQEEHFTGCPSVCNEDILPSHHGHPGNSLTLL